MASCCYSSTQDLYKRNQRNSAYTSNGGNNIEAKIDFKNLYGLEGKALYLSSGTGVHSQTDYNRIAMNIGGYKSSGKNSKGPLDNPLS